MRGLFVTGTGTEVGKSIVAASLIAALTAGGHKVAAFKPAVSGLDEPDPLWPPDHQLLAQATGWQEPGSVSPHLFGPAISPHLAAEQTNTAITLEGLLGAYAAAAQTAELAIVEGVGGVLVPLSSDPELSVLDFAMALALPVLVVARPGLGTISDTRLSVDRLTSEGLTVAAVVLSGWPEQPTTIESSNLKTLRRLLSIDVATLPLTTPGQLAEAAAGLPIERWIQSN